MPTEPERLSATRAVAAGLLAGLLAGLAMTLVMLILASFGVATPLAIMGDRLSVFIPADKFLELMGRVGGYNHMKQLGVGSVIAGQLIVGAIGGAIYGFAANRSRDGRFSFVATAALFILLPLIAVAVVLWPVVGTSYAGFPILPARVFTLGGLAAAFIAFERVLVLSFAFLTARRTAAAEADQEFTPAVGRRAFVLTGVGLLLAGGSAALLRRLYNAATFSYDGTQYKGPGVQPITPNEQFYCVTKNVVDPAVDARLWRLEVTGLVASPQRYRLDRLRALPAVAQETTLMCISNGLDAGLMSNALWRGVPMHTLLHSAKPAASATRVRLHGVDNYTDTIPLDKALDPTTLVVYEMNGEALAPRHGFPVRAIVPGYFGEKHVKWLTRLELTDDTARGFYETQGWGPDFIVPTRSRIDVPFHESTIRRADAASGVLVRGIAFGGDRGISRVELSTDDTATWTDAHLDYPGTKLTWALWSFRWQPGEAGDYALLVRATDGEGEIQELDPDRPFKSGVTGFHRIVVHIA